jgi:hypothetical protein
VVGISITLNIFIFVKGGDTQIELIRKYKLLMPLLKKTLLICKGSCGLCLDLNINFIGIQRIDFAK